MNNRLTSDSIKVLSLPLTVIVIVVLTFLLSIRGLFLYWTQAIECTACLKSFGSSFFNTHQLFFFTLVFVSSFFLFRGYRFLRKELRFHKQSIQEGVQSNQVLLVDNASMAAYSAGFLSQSIIVDKSFWSELTSDEKKALIRHESHHIDQHHSLQFLAIGLAKAMLPIPIIRSTFEQFYLQYRLKSELEADQSAIRLTSRKIVASLLYKAMIFESEISFVSPSTIDAMAMKRAKALVDHQSNIVISLKRDWAHMQFSMVSLSLLLLSLFLSFNTILICLV